ncbi:MAG: DUF3391 domain-containing protein [Anaerolineales bacterium]
MKTKIHVPDLALGMHVAELDRPWRETPFAFQGFNITRQEEIEELKRYCRHVYVVVEADTASAPPLPVRNPRTNKRSLIAAAAEPAPGTE